MRIFLFALASVLATSIVMGEAVLPIYAKHNGAPKHFKNNKGEASGYAVDIASEAVLRAGFTPEMRIRPWKRAQFEALRGKGVITAFSKTPEREKVYLFSIPMYIDRVVLVHTKDNPFEFTGLFNLQDKLIGIAMGSNYSGEFAQFRNILNIEEDGGHRQRLLKLDAGRIDLGIFPGDVFLVRYNATKAGLNPDNFVIKNKEISKDSNHIGIPMSLEPYRPEEVKRKLDHALLEMKKDGTIERIRKRYE